jgi:hypothetical protein
MVATVVADELYMEYGLVTDSAEDRMMVADG